MNMIDAITSGVRKPCNCCDEINYYKYERTSKIYNYSNIAKAMVQYICGTGKKVKMKRWIADCGKCGKLWLVYETRRPLIESLKTLGKPYQKIEMRDSIRNGHLAEK